MSTKNGDWNDRFSCCFSPKLANIFDQTFRLWELSLSRIESLLSHQALPHCWLPLLNLAGQSKLFPMLPYSVFLLIKCGLVFFSFLFIFVHNFLWFQYSLVSSICLFGKTLMNLKNRKFNLIFPFCFWQRSGSAPIFCKHSRVPKEIIKISTAVDSNGCNVKTPPSS